MTWNVAYCLEKGGSFYYWIQLWFWQHLSRRFLFLWLVLLPIGGHIFSSMGFPQQDKLFTCEVIHTPILCDYWHLIYLMRSKSIWVFVNPEKKHWWRQKIEDTEILEILIAAKLYKYSAKPEDGRFRFLFGKIELISVTSCGLFHCCEYTSPVYLPPRLIILCALKWSCIIFITFCANVSIGELCPQYSRGTTLHTENFSFRSTQIFFFYVQQNFLFFLFQCNTWIPALLYEVGDGCKCIHLKHRITHCEPSL